MCLSRGSWAQGEQNQEGNSSSEAVEDLVNDVEPDTRTLIEAENGTGEGGTFYSENFYLKSYLFFIFLQIVIYMVEMPLYQQ